MNSEKCAKKTPPSCDPHSEEKGVLLSDQIAYYAQVYDMIEPFCEEALRPAGYCLHVGEEFMIAGQRFNFEKQNLKDFSIEPYEVAVIKIKEKICLPRFLIGRWDIRVTHAYRGLMWVGGAQVDPGFKGHLYCPIYNLSNRPVRLRRGEKLAVIDFVKTTPLRETDKFTKLFDTERYVNGDFFDYGAQQLESALIKQADEIQDVKEQAKAVDTRMTWFITIVVSLIGLLGLSRFMAEPEFPAIEWKFVVGLFVVVLVLAKTIVLCAQPLQSAWIRGAMRNRRLWAVYSRIRLYGFRTLGGLAIAGIVWLLYLITFQPLEGLNKRTTELESKIESMEEIVEQISESK